VLTIGIAMQNPINYKVARAVPIGIVMQNSVNCKGSNCAIRHCCAVLNWLSV